MIERTLWLRNPISVQEIKELIFEACQAPSSFNIQHWRFIAVTDERIRERLKGTATAPNQERVVWQASRQSS
jgi:nitroreductase